VARHEARAAVENKLINVPELYYEDGFDDNVIVDWHSRSFEWI
jgi:hypothetical protein